MSFFNSVGCEELIELEFVNATVTIKVDGFELTSEFEEFSLGCLV
jgi:hypothetical protein